MRTHEQRWMKLRERRNQMLWLLAFCQTLGFVAALLVAFVLIHWTLGLS